MVGGTGWTAREIGFRYLIGARDISALCSVYTGSGAFSTCYPVGTKGLSSGG
jgi:hypothetical protein